MRIGIVREFDSAHYIPGHKTCGKLHGHRWRVLVTLQGESGSSDMLIDFNDVKKIVDGYDHKNLNDILEVPTAENLVKDIISKLKYSIGVNGYDVEKIVVKLWETPKSWASEEEIL